MEISLDNLAETLQVKLCKTSVRFSCYAPISIDTCFNLCGIALRNTHAKVMSRESLALCKKMLRLLFVKKPNCIMFISILGKTKKWFPVDEAISALSYKPAQRSYILKAFENNKKPIEREEMPQLVKSFR